MSCASGGRSLTRRPRPCTTAWLWSRASEEHIEYAHTPERLAQLLTQAGFLDVTVRRDGPQADAGRIFLTAMRSLEYGV